MKEQFLFTGNGDAVFGGGLEGPSLDRGEHRSVDSLAHALSDLGLDDSAFLIDRDVDDDITAGAVGEDGEVGPWPGKVGSQGHGDIARAEGIVALRRRSSAAGRRSCHGGRSCRSGLQLQVTGQGCLNGLNDGLRRGCGRTTGVVDKGEVRALAGAGMRDGCYAHVAAAQQGREQKGVEPC